MYSRYYGNRQGDLRLPENYSGCAFPREATEKERTHTSPPPSFLHDPPLTKKPPADPPPLILPSVPEEDPPTSENDACKEAPSPAPSSAPPLPAPTDAPAHGLLSHLSKGLDFDQLLIMGLILLLLHSGEDSEMVLWLVLLLFC